MKIQIVCIGNELLRGTTVNSNLAFIGRALMEAGYSVDREVCIPDTPSVVREAVSAAHGASDVVITTGGLGPTADDVTCQAVADVMGLGVRLDQGVLTEIRSYLRKRNVERLPEALESQAMIPVGSLVMPNTNGTAPGLACEDSEGAVVMLPGPPRELQPIFRNSVLPWLRQRGGPDCEVKQVKICSTPESVVARKVGPILSKFPDIDVGYCASPPAITVYLSAPYGHTGELDAAGDSIRKEFGKFVLPVSCPGVCRAMGELLTDRGWYLAVAESCTGGLIASSITENSGASGYFVGGVVTYANTWKKNLLGVPAATLADFGAVSVETADKMLDGLFRNHDIRAGIVTTGIAGPDGGTPSKPVGLVYVGTGVLKSRTIRKFIFPGTRETVRKRAAAAGINQLYRELVERI